MKKTKFSRSEKIAVFFLDNVVPRRIVGPPCGFSWYDINLGVEHALIGILT